MNVLFRLAWREIRRHKIRTLLIGLLTALPIAIVSVIIMMLPGLEARDLLVEREHIGESDLRILPRGYSTRSFEELQSIGADLVERLGPDATVVPGFQGSAYAEISTDRLQSMSVDIVDAGHDMMQSRFPLKDGRYPTKPGEAIVEYIPQHAITAYSYDDRVAEPIPHQFATGDLITIEPQFSPDGISVPIEIVGTYERFYSCFTCNGIAVYPGTLGEDFFNGLGDDSTMRAMWFAQLPGWTGTTADHVAFESQTQGLPIVSESAYNGFIEVNMSEAYGLTFQLIVLIMATFLLFWTGLVSACGFAVGLRRRRRELGLLAANGADPTKLKVAAAAEAFVVGLMASIAGFITAVVVVGAIYVWVIPRVRTTLVLVDGVGPFAMKTSHFLLVGGLVALGILSCVAAGWAASVGLSKQTPAALMAGQTRRPRPVSQWLFLGGILVIAGGLIFYAATRQFQDDSSIWWSFLGLSLIIVGSVPLVVSTIRFAGLFGSFGPLTSRLAGRDLVRQGIRTGAAASAVCLTIAAGVVVIVGLEPQLPSYYFDYEAPDGRTVDSSAEPPSNPGLRSETYRPQVGVDTSTYWWNVTSPDVSRHEIGLTRERHIPDSTIADIRSQGWTVSSFTRTLQPEHFNGCRFTTDALCPDQITIVDDATIDLLPASVADALRSEGFANLVVPEASIITDAGHIELPRMDVAPECPDCDLEFMGYRHSMLMTLETAAEFGVDGQHFLSRQVVTIESSADTEAELAALSEDLAKDGWALGHHNGFESGSVYSYGEANRFIRSAVLVSVNIITLLVVAVSLALVRVESKSEDQVLAISGGSPRTTRLLNAWRSTLIVISAMIPAIPLGIMVWVIVLDRTPIPWRWLSMLAISLLVLSPLVGALGARHTTKISAR